MTGCFVEMEFDHYLHEFLQRVLNARFPFIQLARPEDRALNSDPANGPYLHRTQQIERFLFGWVPKSAMKLRERRLEELATVGEALLDEQKTAGLTHQTDRFDITYSCPTRSDLDADFIQVKINHGFWEQLYVVLFDGYDAETMRVENKAGYAAFYLEHFFYDALRTAMQDFGKVEDGTVSFPGVRFGFSFASGDDPHADVMRAVAANDAIRALMASGAAIGCSLMLQDAFGCKKARFDDGCFPKVGLDNGDLEAALKLSASFADEILFVVPPHLSGITYAGAPAQKQKIQLVSGAVIHQAWMLHLHLCGERIYNELKSGRSLTIITQSAVFSALLGLFLKKMKDDLNLSGRLHYFDLGQVLDTASPEAGGHWIKFRKGKASPFRLG